MERAPVHYVMWRISRGGAELMVNQYIDSWAKKRPLYAYSLRPMDRGVYDESAIRLQEGPSGTLNCYRAYFHYCRQHRKAIFHLMNAGPIILLLTLMAGVKNPIYHVHGTKYYKKKYDYLYLKPAWLLSRYFFRVTFVANSEYSASVFRDKALPLKPKVIYNGFEVERFSAHQKLRKRPRRLGYAGRLHQGKNVEVVLRLFNEVAGEFPELELWIAGDGPLRPALEKEAEESPYRDRIKFLGFIDDIPAFYGAVDLFVFLSAYESFGNVLAEALLTGLPVLTSDIPVFREIHGGEKMFILGDPRNAVALKRQFLKALECFPELAQKAIATGKRIRENFSLEQHVQAIGALYEQR